MDQAIIKKIKGWAGMATYDSWHPLDMERFYRFVIESYKQKEHISADEFRSRIIEFSGRDIGEENFWNFYGKYESGLELLKIYNE